MQNSKILLLLAGFAMSVGSQAGQYQLTITNLGPQPLSPLFFSLSDSSFDIFQVGGSASLGIKGIAEGGNTTAMNAIAAAAGSAVGLYGVLGGSPLAPGNVRSTMFTTDSAHSKFSFATMLGKTNDGWIGESVSSMGLDLYSGGNPQGFSLIISGNRAWDAGTEKNTQSAVDLGFLGGSGNPAEEAGLNTIRVHGGVVNGLGEFAQMPAWDQNTQLARIEVQAVPEPATILILASGIGAMLKRKRRGE